MSNTVRKLPGIRISFKETTIKTSPTFSASFESISKKYDLSNKPRRPKRCEPLETPEITDESIEIALRQMEKPQTVDWIEVKEDLSL